MKASPRDQRLYYEDPNDNPISVAIGRDQNGEPIPGRATPLFDLRAMRVSTENDQSYDASPAAEEWIFIRTGAETTTEGRAHVQDNRDSRARDRLVGCCGLRAAIRLGIGAGRHA